MHLYSIFISLVGFSCFQISLQDDIDKQSILELGSLLYTLQCEPSYLDVQYQKWTDFFIYVPDSVTKLVYTPECDKKLFDTVVSDRY